VVLNYPSNPTGGSYEPDELRHLAEVASRYRVVLLSDEIYGKLHHEGRHTSVVPYYPEGTIFSGGLSKWCGAGGWRLGLFVVPRCMQWLQDAMATVASETFTSTSAPIQYAAVAAFEQSDNLDRYVDGCRRVLRALGRRLAATLEAAGVAVTPPAGAFYLFPDFSPLAESLARHGITTSAQLCERLLEETGVAILPGSEFGRPPGELTARLAYVNFDGGQALDAAARIPRESPLDETFLRQHCGDPLAAVELLVDWLADKVSGAA
jgi:aspartate aminotransferase